MSEAEDLVSPQLRNDLIEIAQELRRLNRELARILRSSLYYKVRFWATMGGLMTLHLGLVLLLGAPARVSAAAYTIIAAYGGGRMWGATFISSAIFTLLCAWRLHSVLRWALLAEATLYGLLAISFAIASNRFPDANLTAAPVYTWVMIAHAFLSDIARREFLIDRKGKYGSSRAAFQKARRFKRAARTRKRPHAPRDRTTN